MPHFPQGQGSPSVNQLLGLCPSVQLNTADLYKTPEPLNTNSNNLNDAPDSANNQEALCANKIQNRPWIDVPEETQEKQWKEGACILCGLEDALDHGPDPDMFFILAALLCTIVLTLDDLLAHLPSHSFHILLLCTTLSCITLPFSNDLIPTLVDSGATDNFIDKFLAALAS
ncbi:hypothetical protein E4T56_gene4526 [Termitomyces sp. T112]|nr:hypothetical protein E4T56_gene4526 [Termitomyces sp. T112]